MGPIGDRQPVLLSRRDYMDTRVFRLFLGLLGDAPSGLHPGEVEVETCTADRTLLIRLTAVPTAPVVEIPTDDGIIGGGPNTW
ncbi:hypothetical protein ACIHDR_47710 [Nocardia sp. NPDC052278]|uniref:hypothetical protein n=1 Tax=unclassified Nocardia TaxID=2637762 RepID=UPI0036AE363E